MANESQPFLNLPDDSHDDFASSAPVVPNSRDSTDVHDGSYNPQKALKERHIGVMAIAGMLGTGLFLTSGRSLADAGPAGALLGYALMGLVTISGAACLVALTAAEMSAFSPATGGFIAHAQRFVDPALGAATGWNFAYALAIVQAVEIVASTLLVSFWTDAIPQALLITVFWFAMITVNMMPVRVFGEVNVMPFPVRIVFFLHPDLPLSHLFQIEFFFGLVKICLVIGLFILGLVIDFGATPQGRRIGFEYWRHDAFKALSYGVDNSIVVGGFKGRFLAVWSTLVNAAFAFAHVQIIAIAGAETVHARRAIPRALFRTSLGVFVLYTTVIFSIGLVLPSTHPGLRAHGGTALSSPFVIAAKEAGIGVTSIFVSSRSLVSLATTSTAPRIFTHTNKHGVPYFAVLASSTFGAFSYLSLHKTAAEGLMWLVNLSAIAGLVSWCVLCYAYLALLNGLRAQGYTRDDLPYNAPLQPCLGYFALAMCLLVLITSGFTVFLPGNFTWGAFLSNYANLFVFSALYAIWKRMTGSKYVDPSNMKLKPEFEAIHARTVGDESPVEYALIPDANTDE
ncbi:hypothetical protein FRB99_003012 [Tulasnella sp. 403]|nr:hypothetical protein FRB99_003012 [Tulasnella sp. 403]